VLPDHLPGTTGSSGNYGFQMVLLGRAHEWALVTSDDGAVMAMVLPGVANAQWDTVFTAAANGSNTLVKASFVEDASSGSSWTVDGAWAIPTVGVAQMPVGLSADGNTLVLVEAQPSSDQTRFALLRTQSSAAPVILSLPGHFAFDAISPDGAVVYVLEYRDADRAYFVRSVDTHTGKLDEAVIVDKREADELMAGIPIGQRQDGKGTVYTLYQGPEHPFVHMLLTADKAAFCIDLPSAWGHDESNAAAWGVTISTDARNLFVANTTLGVAGEVNLESLEVVRTTSFMPTATVQLAKFGGGKAGPAGGEMVLSPDKSTLYVADNSGVLAITTSDLKIKARLLAGTPVVSLGMAGNGNVLYTVGRDGSALRVDARSGEVLSRISGSGYTAVLRIVEPQ
jgi:hypothetical protein